MSFKLLKKSKKSKARLGILRTAHGVVRTPFFMPIATKGAVKGIEAREMPALGAEILLANTYHLYLQPGMKVLERFGDMHRFMHSDLPILTDSGGFQVFSLSRIRAIDEHGVTFNSTLDGSKHRLTPKKAIEIQAALGSDIMMALDYFPGYPTTQAAAEESVRLTARWAQECFSAKQELSKHYAAVKKQQLYCIVQGSVYQALREKSARSLRSVGSWDGYAIGGLAVGEPVKKMYEVVDFTIPLLPEDTPRYLMGVGYPEQIVEAVKRGIDMFDCVIPTREGRHGRLFVWSPLVIGKSVRTPLKVRGGSLPAGRQGGVMGRGNASITPPPPLTLRGVKAGNFYTTLNITNAQFKSDTKPVDPTCDCQLCKNYSRAYLYQLFRTQDFLGQRLATIHNLRFYLQLMERLRLDIKSGIL